MNVRRFSSGSRRGDSRIKRRLCWEQGGVASTVGTIMALMIFLTFLSLFTNQYVPIWMEDNEASHMHSVEAQFGELKQSIDIQIMGAMLDDYELSLYTPVTLGAQGVPMFAAPTLGVLSVNPDPAQSSTSVEFYYNASGQGLNLIEEQSSGSIKLEAANRYYVPQSIVYENDGLILAQSDGQLFKAPPQFNLRKEGARYHMSYTQVTIMGDNQSYAGSDTRGVQTRARFAQSFTYEDVQTNSTGALVDGIPNNGWIYFNQTTYYGNAWVSYFNSTLQDEGLIKGTDFFITQSVVGGTDVEPLYFVSMRLSTDLISSFTLTVSNFDVSISDYGA